MNIHATGCEPVYVLKTLNHKTLPDIRNRLLGNDGLLVSTIHMSILIYYSLTPIMLT